MEHFITVSEGAALSGKSYSTVWRWGMKGKIRMESHAGVRMVSESSLLAYIKPVPAAVAPRGDLAVPVEVPHG